MSAAPTAEDFAPGVRAIDCTNCGAGLPVLGGGRVVTQVCGYCGASLDAGDAYKVLAVHAGMARPESPFRLGMRGRLEGADWTVIGTLGFVERDGGRTWRWTDHMLHSPTHGYAWLTWEDGHALFTRKVRDMPEGPWLTEAMVERAEAQPGRRWRGRAFRYFASSDWLCDFAEGEFNFRPAKGDRGYSVSLMSTGAPPTMLTYLEPRGGAAREREVDVTRYAPEAVAAFGAEAPAPPGLHPLQPYEGGSPFYRLWFGAMTAAAAALLAVVVVLGGSAEEVLRARASDLPAEATFAVADAARPVSMELRTGLDDGWVEMGLDVTGPDGAPVVGVPLGLSYYSGVEDGESWSEGSRTARLGFQPPAAGTYRVALSRPEGETARLGEVALSVREGTMTARWPVIALALFGAAFALSLSGRLIHASRRWSRSDWSED